MYFIYIYNIFNNRINNYKTNELLFKYCLLCGSKRLIHCKFSVLKENKDIYVTKIQKKVLKII
jgi:hypothetical protein